MTALFQSLGRTVAAGFALLILLVVLIGLASGHMLKPDHAWSAFLMRYLHILCGIMWIGLLYYFNFVQIPTVPTIEPAEHRAAVSKYIAPRALFWFRHAALATVATGLLLATMNRYLVEALTLQKGVLAIGLGMWIALVMAFNVWFIIWPNQKKALGIVTVDADAKARAARVALVTSRLNTLLSVPMLYFMVAQSHGGL